MGTSATGQVAMRVYGERTSRQVGIAPEEKLVRLFSSPSLVDAIRHPGAFVSGDNANIKRLAEQIDCSLEQAASVYRLARRVGYPSAHRSVFGSSSNRAIGRQRTFAETIGARIAPSAPRPRPASGRSG